MTVKMSLPLATVIHNALRAEAKTLRREFTEHVQRILAEHAIHAGYVKPNDAESLRLMWKLVEQAVEAAKAICRNGQFTSAITLASIQACKKDPEWLNGYRAFVQDDIYKNGNPLKGIINREIGFRIRAGIGGKVVTDANGKHEIVKVLGEIIQSFTPMESFDPEAVQEVK
ncbi:MAG: hypothetical protein WAV18_03820 [Roseiarcus sp.]